MKCETISDAAHRWVGEFNAIPQILIAKLIKLDPDEVYEITPPGSGDQVYIMFGEYEGKYGNIIGLHDCGENEDENDSLYDIRVDGKDDVVIVLDRNDFEVQNDDYLPMWGTMWSFGDSCDDWWLEEDDGIRAMSDCGFRIYKSEDYGYFFGIDGAGYDFYEEHWMPLYKARGLHWHDPQAEEDYQMHVVKGYTCLLYTSPSPRDGLLSRMPSSA